MLSKTPGWRNASQLACATCAEIGQGLFSQPVELARCGILLDLLVEALRLERLEPGSEPYELIGRKFSYGLFNVFKSGHSSHPESPLEKRSPG